MLFYTLFQLQRWGVDGVVMNLHYKGDMIRSVLRAFPHFPIEYSDEKTILGTAGGIRKGLEMLGSEPFLLMNPDVIVFADEMDHPRYAVQQMSAERDTCLSLCVKETDSLETGWDLNGAGLVHRADPGQYYYMGCSVVRPRMLAALDSGMFAELGPFWVRRAAEGVVCGRRWNGSVTRVGTARELESLPGEPLVPQELREQWSEFLNFQWST